MAKKFAVLFCLPTDTSEHASQVETFLQQLQDTKIYSCLGSASCTKYQEIQNNRKYKHQFVFQVYNVLFTKIGREGKGVQPHILSRGDQFAPSSGGISSPFLKSQVNSFRILHGLEARRRGGGEGAGREGGRRTAGTRGACTEPPHAFGDASTLLDIDTGRHYVQELRSQPGAA